jgi:hypothetical protein
MQTQEIIALSMCDTAYCFPLSIHNPERSVRTAVLSKLTWVDNSQITQKHV